MSLKSLAYALSPSAAHPLLKKIESSDIGLRLARGVFWSLAGTIVSRGLMLCATILVARMLGREAYGELGMIQSTVGMLGTFAGFSLGVTATKHVAEFRQSDPERTGRIIALSGLFAAGTGGLMALLLVIFAPWLAENTINAPHLAGVLRISALVLFLNALNSAQIGVLSGFESFKTIAKVSLFVGLISFPIFVAGAYVGGLAGAVWALAINLVFNWLLNHLALRREAKRNNVSLALHGCWREWPILWRFSLPGTLAGSMVGPVGWISSALLVNRPNGYAEMGIFSAANQWYVTMLFLPGILGASVLPILSSQISQNNASQLSKTLTLAIKLNLITVVPLVVVACLASPYIMSIYGKEYADGWPTLIVTLITAGILAIQTPVGQIIASSGRMWTGFAMNIGWGLLFLSATLLLIDYGSLGLASARLISYVIHAIWTFGFAIWLVRALGNKTF
jgi:O-antigen/teichoic acid export membrane protein